MDQAPSSEQLWIAVQGRDADALGELFTRFAPSLMGMLQRILGDRQAAEEVLDEVFLQLWSEAPRLKNTNGSVEARLVITARAAAVLRLRAERGAGSEAGRSGVPLAWLPQPEDVSALDRRRELLKKAMKQLPPSQRRLLDLAVFEGYTETELAAKLGQPLGQVKSELRAAMRFLRHRLRAVLGTWSAKI